MSKKPTAKEKAAFRDICILKREKDSLEKQVREATQEWAKKKKDARGMLPELLGEHECMRVADDKFVRRIKTSRMLTMKEDMIRSAFQNVSRAEVLAAVKKDGTVWDALIECLKRYIDDSRRVFSESVMITKNKPPKSCAVQNVSEEMRQAVAAIETLDGYLRDAREKAKPAKEDLADKIKTHEQTIMAYMRRAKKDSQDIHIGLVDNIQRSYRISRKRRRGKSLTPGAVYEKIQTLVSQLSNLDDFLDDRDSLCDRVLNSLSESSPGEEYVSLRDVGLREI